MERTYGSKHNAKLTTVEICKAIRADLKAALPAFKCSVRKDHHRSISIEVVAAPAGFVVLASDIRMGHGADGWMTKEAAAVHAQIEAIAAAYNHDGSDTMSDYFDVNFYLTTRFASELRNAAKPAPAAPVESAQVEFLRTLGAL